jgi:EAL domain-containing protein (putative c-di-GMP-specific phosphodiesterase class I)
MKTNMIKYYKAGDIIFNEGEEGDCAYIVENGKVEVFIDSFDQRTAISILGVGDIFGEMAIIDGSNRSASALAITDCSISIISKDRLNERIHNADPIVRFLVSVLISRVRSSIKKTKMYTQVNYSLDEFKKAITEDHTKTDKHVIEKFKLEQELQNALVSNELEMYFQPIIDLSNGKISGFESLVRWNNSSRGTVSPEVFMSIAEETSLILPLGHWVIKNSIKSFSQILKHLKYSHYDVDNLFISINVSAKQIKDQRFFDVLNKSVFQYKVKPSNIKLEITEQVLIDRAFIFGWIKTCNDLGYQIALDDFGTGYSSFSYLQKLAVQNIKIDKSFIQSVEDDKTSKIILKTIIDMAKGLEIPVIAEGIEKSGQMHELQKLNCKFGQGYYFSRPLPQQEIIKFLKSVEKKAA